MSGTGLLAAALIADALVGEPAWLWKRVPHPTVLAGRFIAEAEKRLNHAPARLAKGVALTVTLAAGAFLVGKAITLLPGGDFLEFLSVTILLAHRSLSDHVLAVADALDQSLNKGKKAVSHIVGRDTRDMTESDVARAAIESAAENLSDGVVAPLFWYLLLGLPGMMTYKVINTADSMIGYRTAQLERFGWAAARLDDLVNWLPARLTAALIALADGSVSPWKAAMRDGKLHRSPNAGWPEAAMAASLDIRLAGPRSYDGSIRAYPYVNESGRLHVGSADIRRAVRKLWRVWAVLLVASVLLAVA